MALSEMMEDVRAEYLNLENDYKEAEAMRGKNDVYIKNSTLKPCHAVNQEYFGKKPKENYLKFQTSGIFVNNTQEELYRVISQDIFSKIFSGENVIIMANGQHNSGKSFTMTGFTSSYENRGISLRLIDDLLQEINARKSHIQTEIYLSHIDFAAETMIDLMTEPASNLSNFNHAKKLKVTTKEQLIKAVILSQKRRWIEGLSSHCASSVFTFHLKCISKVKSEPYDYYPRIQLVELSGVETTKYGKDQGCQQKVNKDMAAMSLYLASKDAARFTRSPSRLVTFLADRWNNSFIRVICHLKPTSEKNNLNISTLLFASRLMQRPLYSFSLERIDNPVNTLHSAFEIIQRLEEELLVREMIVGEGFRHVGIVSQREMDLVLQACSEYLQGQLSIESLLASAHPHILIRAFKKKFELIFSKEANLSYESSAFPPNMGVKFDKPTPKLSVFSKKRVGALKKVRGMSDGSEFVPRQSEEFIQIEPRHPQEIPDRETIEAEFYTRYPDIKAQLNLALDNYQNALKFRDEFYDQYEQLKKEAVDEKNFEEEMEWKRRLELGECVGPDGRQTWISTSKSPVQEAAQFARKEAIEALNAFTTARDILTELKASIEEKIQEYMETAYGLRTPTIDAEDIKICYAENVSFHSESQEQMTPEDTRIKDLFYAIQRSKNRSSPFQKKAKWI